MAIRRHDSDPQIETSNLVRKLLVLQLFELNVPQAQIAKKLRTDIRNVNSFLKGIKKSDGDKKP